uniref:START domain-containing protein n=1 Tax=Heterorhabditis bacteriophora TaxID=37862 RepID=A0A1I7XDT3_HETBA
MATEYQSSIDLKALLESTKSAWIMHADYFFHCGQQSLCSIDACFVVSDTYGMPSFTQPIALIHKSITHLSSSSPIDNIVPFYREDIATDIAVRNVNSGYVMGEDGVDCSLVKCTSSALSIVATVILPTVLYDLPSLYATFKDFILTLSRRLFISSSPSHTLGLISYGFYFPSFLYRTYQVTSAHPLILRVPTLSPFAVTRQGESRFFLILDRIEVIMAL